MAIGAIVQSAAAIPLRLAETTPLAQQMRPLPDISASADVQTAEVARATAAGVLGSLVDIRA